MEVLPLPLPPVRPITYGRGGKAGSCCGEKESRCQEMGQRTWALPERDPDHPAWRWAGKVLALQSSDCCCWGPAQQAGSPPKHVPCSRGVEPPPPSPRQPPSSRALSSHRSPRLSPPHPRGPQQCPQQPLPEAGGADLLLLVLTVVGVLHQQDLIECQLGEPLRERRAPRPSGERVGRGSPPGSGTGITFSSLFLLTASPPLRVSSLTTKHCRSGSVTEGP